MQMGSDAADFSVTGFSEQYHSAIHGGSFDNYAAYRAYFTERVAHLIRRLREEDDPAGGKLIDSTLVVQVTDMGDKSRFKRYFMHKPMRLGASWCQAQR